MPDLRSKLIRLAHDRPDLRAALLPLVKEATLSLAKAIVTRLEVKYRLPPKGSSAKFLSVLVSLAYYIVRNEISHEASDQFAEIVWKTSGVRPGMTDMEEQRMARRFNGDPRLLVLDLLKEAGDFTSTIRELRRLWNM